MEVDSEIVAAFINAAVNDHPEAARLLDANSNLRQATWMGDEPLLHFLVIENFPQAVEFCLMHGFDPNQVDALNEDSALIYASLLDYTEVAAILLAGGADPNAKSSINENPLHCCVSNGNARLVDLLIQSGADPNYTTESGETIFDNWPAWARAELQSSIDRHKVKRPA